jgi:hypothetical protein
MAVTMVNNATSRLTVAQNHPDPDVSNDRSVLSLGLSVCLSVCIRVVSSYVSSH